MYKQYALKSGDLERIAWLDRTNLKKGQRVTLKNDKQWPERLWEVVAVYDKTEDQPQWRTWKVGGLR